MLLGLVDAPDPLQITETVWQNKTHALVSYCLLHHGSADAPDPLWITETVGQNKTHALVSSCLLLHGLVDAPDPLHITENVMLNKTPVSVPWSVQLCLLYPEKRLSLEARPGPKSCPNSLGKRGKIACGGGHQSTLAKVTNNSWSAIPLLLMFPTYQSIMFQ